MLEEVRELDRRHLIHPSTSMRAHDSAGPHLFVRGEGAKVFDSEGRPFIDAFAGMGALAVGHGRRELAEAAYRQMQALAYHPTYYGGGTPPAAELAAALAGAARGRSTTPSSPRGARSPTRRPSSWRGSTGGRWASRGATRCSHATAPTAA